MPNLVHHVPAVGSTTPTWVLVSYCAVGFTTVSSAIAHLLVAATAHGPMSWMLVAMALACLAGLVPLRATGPAVRRGALHLMVMSAVMVLGHAAWLLLAGGHHAADQEQVLPGADAPDAHAEHLILTMLVELVSLAAASSILRTVDRRNGSLRPVA